jgi:hypothetical protein
MARILGSNAFVSSHFSSLTEANAPWRIYLTHHVLLSRLSTGKRSFISAIIGTSILGALLTCVAVMGLTETSSHGAPSRGYIYWSIFAGSIGGAGGFLACYERWLGHAGASGWLTALIGTLVVSGVSSVIAGTLILPIYGTMFGPLQMIITMIKSPLLGVTWLLMLLCAHGLLSQWRTERDSVFSTM